MLHVQSCCFAFQTYCFFEVLAPVAVVVAKVPYLVNPGGGEFVRKPLPESVKQSLRHVVAIRVQ